MSFQETLNQKRNKYVLSTVPTRVDLVRLFQAFVGEQTDEQWLASLEHLNAADEKGILKALKWLVEL
jgi:CRISPR-associated endonuclease/helicase Cas3